MVAQVLLLLATASLETGQARTALNCIDRLRDEAKAAVSDMDIDGGAAANRTTGSRRHVPRCLCERQVANARERQCVRLSLAHVHSGLIVSFPLSLHAAARRAVRAALSFSVNQDTGPAVVSAKLLCLLIVRACSCRD